MTIVEKIKALGLPDWQFVVMGSSLLEVKGIRKANDLDIMVRGDLFEKLKQDPSWQYTHKIGKRGDTMDFLQRGDIQLYLNSYNGETFEYFVNDPALHQIIEGMYFCTLLNLLQAKSGSWDRPKDREDARLIQEYLNKGV